MQAVDLTQSATENASMNGPEQSDDSDTVNDSRGAQPNDEAHGFQGESAEEPVDEPRDKPVDGYTYRGPCRRPYTRTWKRRFQKPYGEPSEEFKEGPPREPDEDPYEPFHGAGYDSSTTASTIDPAALPEEQARDVAIGVRFYDTRGFYNRVVKDEGDFAIEALVGSFDAVENGSRLEYVRRRRIVNRRDGDLLPDDVNHRGCGPQTSLPANTLGITERISMVRIRSASVVRAIIEFGGYSRMPSDKSLDGKQFLFPRPFTSFFYCQKDMKRRLSELQRRLEETGSGSDRSKTAAPQPFNEVSDRALKKRAVEELQLYIEFVDSYIMPLWKQFDKVSDKTPRAVSYGDIPLLFKAGELAYVRPPVEIRNNPNSGIQTVFRMVRSTRDSCRSKGNIFWSVYCLDYQDGSYRALWRKIQFPHFDGLASITELPCYPLKFHPDCESLLAHRIAEGENFRKCVEVGIRDIYYSGWTLVTGTLPNSYDDGKIPEPEHVESEVIIDFKEGLRHLPSAFFETGDGRLDEYPCEDEKPYEAEAGDAAVWPEYRIWRKSGGQEYHEIQENLFSREDAVHRKTWQEIEKRDKFLTSNGDIAGADFTGQDLAILPKRVPGYVLRERKFAILDVMNFETNRATEKASLDVVQMPPEHKRIIKSAVAAHFQKRHRERSHRTTSHGVDIVRGKGNGLILLLHGPPGTGKTLTAEAVALENKKPLFPITCGDLGFTPDKVEQSLKDIFRYAHLWDCILLLDEADVFLTRRNVTDIQRNALVSVFLRVLEYYSGILFLTTNRVGAIDEAFRSRIHISLNYKYLDCEDTIAILDTHLGRLPRRHPKSANIGNSNDAVGGIVSEGGVEEPRMIVRDHEIRSYIRQEWHKYAKIHNRERGPWNGRQIRNAVHVATCLAIYESQLDNSRGEGDSDGDGGGGGGGGGSADIVVLTADHFRTVGKTTDEFDDYMKRVRRADADTMARMAGERDDFDDDEAYEMARFEGFNPSGPAVYYDQQHLHRKHPSAGGAAAGLQQQGARSRRGEIRQPSQRMYSGGAGRGAPQQQRSSRSSREEYLDHMYEPTERARMQTGRFQSENRAPRGLRSNKGEEAKSHNDEGEYGDEPEPEPEPGYGDGDKYEDEQWQEEAGAYRTSALQGRAVNQNRGYAWGRGENTE